MTPAETTLPAQLKPLRLVWAAMICGVMVFIAVAEILAIVRVRRMDGLYWLLVFLGTWCAAMSVRLRRRSVRRSFATLGSGSSDERAFRQWRAGWLVSLWCGEATALYGLLARFM